MMSLPSGLPPPLSLPRRSRPAHSVVEGVAWAADQKILGLRTAIWCACGEVLMYVNAYVTRHTGK